MPTRRRRRSTRCVSAQPTGRTGLKVFEFFPHRGANGGRFAGVFTFAPPRCLISPGAPRIATGAAAVGQNVVRGALAPGHRVGAGLRRGGDQGQGAPPPLRRRARPVQGGEDLVRVQAEPPTGPLDGDEAGHGAPQQRVASGRKPSATKVSSSAGRAARTSPTRCRAVIGSPGARAGAGGSSVRTRPDITAHRWAPHRPRARTSSTPLNPTKAKAAGVKSVSVWATTRRAQPALSRTNGPHRHVRRRGSTPLRVGTTLAATPTIIRLRKPTVTAWRTAP